MGATDLATFLKGKLDAMHPPELPKIKVTGMTLKAVGKALGESQKD